MAINIANTTTTNTFEYWRLRTNNMANAFRLKAVTVASNTAVGSAAITGTFSGGNLKANGTTQSTSTTTGSLQSKGGLGVSRNAHIGGKLVVTGVSNTANINVSGGVVVSGNVTASLFSGNGSSLTSVDANTLGGVSGTSFLRSDAADTAANKITLTTGIELASTADANLVVGTTNLPNTANIKISEMSGQSNKYLRVNSDGSKLVFANSTLQQVGEIGDIQINYAGISNADVLVYDENSGKFVNRPRPLIDVTSVDDIDDVNITKSPGDLLIRVVNTSNTETFANTSNGFITGRLDSMSETELTGSTSNTISFVSTSNSLVQLYINGVKQGNTDFSVTNTSQISLTSNLVSSDIVQIIEFNPHAFVVGDGTPSDLNQLNYSDLRLKTDVTSFEASSSVFDIEKYSYYWKDTERFHDRQEIGFVAQNLEQYVPELVTENSSGEKMVDYGKMTAVLLSTIKQMDKRIKALESKAFCKCPEE